MNLKIKKLHKDAKIPQYAYPDDAAFDLFAVENLKITPNERVQILTGIAVQIPRGHVGLIWDKSGLSHNHGLKTLGGVVDSGYRGEIKVGLINLGKENYQIEKGHKVAQMIIQKKETYEIIEVDELDGSDRGEAGFGSSGK
jgi:dUTP pyrophosphatase